MNTAVLIEGLVRQTTVLIATLATAAGQRATLSRIADQVFADLVEELNDQGVGHKVIAEMFGMALRTYHDRVARVAASRTDQGRSLWEAVLTHAEAHGPITRAQLLERFAHDDDATVRGVLRDLVESRLLYQTGRGDETTYRAADPREALGRNRDPQTLERLVQVAIYRHGPYEDANREEVFVDFPGQEYRAFDATLKDGTFTFWTSTMDLWTDWCALQTPHPYKVGSVSGYRCVPDPPPPDSDSTKVMLCSSRLDYATCGHGHEACTVCGPDTADPACIDLDAACRCTAEHCTANLRATAEQFQFVMTGTTTMRGHLWNDVMPADTPYEADNIHLQKVSP